MEDGIERCECGGRLVGEEEITPLTDDNPMSWHRLWYDIAKEVEKGARFCERCHRIYYLPSLPQAGSGERESSMPTYVLYGECFVVADRFGPAKDQWEDIVPERFEAENDEAARQYVQEFIAKYGELRNARLERVTEVSLD